MNQNNKLKTSYLNNHFDIFVCVFITVAILATYWGVWNYDFINFDDDIYVTKNPNVRTGLTKENIYWAFTNNSNYWQPLAWLSHMLVCELFAVDPGMHHLVNLLLHVVNSLLLFLVFRRITGAKWENSFIAVLFALHPLSVDSVAWIAERKNVLCTLWWILGIWSYSLFAEKPGLFRYVLTLIFFIFGLMTKPMSVTIPFVLLLLDYWPLDKYWQKHEMIMGDENKSLFVKLKSIDISHRVLEKIPFFILTLLYFYFFFATIEGVGTIKTEIVPMTLRISNALVSYTLYIWKLVWPFKLAIYYPFPKSIPVWQSAGSGLILIFITFILTRLTRKLPFFMVGWFWFIGTLIPVTGLVQTGLWPQIADRWMYIPQIGIYIFIVFGTSKVISELYFIKKPIILIIPIMLIVMITATWFQVKHWKNSITIFQHAINVTQNNKIAHNNLGVALNNIGRKKEAIHHFGLALTSDPDYAEANYNMGVLLYYERMVDKAVRLLSRALINKPNYYEAHTFLGMIMQNLGQKSKSIRHYQEALRIRPNSPNVFIVMGSQYEKQSNFTAAAKCYRAAIRLNPKNEAGYLKLGILQYKSSQIEEGKYNLKRAVQINPSNANARKYLNKIIELKKINDD